MSEIKEKREVSFTDYLSILFKWKRFMIVNLLIIVLVTTGLSFLIPEKFRAVTSIMINDAGNSSPLNALANSAVGSLLGSSLFGSSTSSVDKMFGYLESRTLMEKVINEFNLVEYYEITKYKQDKTLAALKENLAFDLTDNGFIEIVAINKDPRTAADMANYIVEQLEKINTEYSTSFAKSYREFVEKRYNKNIIELKNAGNDFEEFQKKYKVYAIPEQFEIAFQAIGKLETELVLKELEADLLRETQGTDNPNYIQAEKHVMLLQKKLNDILNGKHLSDESIVFIDLSKLPKLQQEYLEVRRELEIQTKLIEFTLPMYEQALMEEQKNIPVVVVIDEAVPPELKYSPKKAFIILSVFFISFFIFLLFVTRGETLINKKNEGIELNAIQSREYNFYLNIVKFYKLKF